MSTVKLAIVYYSATGTVDAMAHRAAAAGEKAGAEVRLRRVAREATTGERQATEAQAAHAEAAPEVPAATADDICGPTPSCSAPPPATATSPVS